MHGERPQAVPLIEPITFWKVMTTHIRLPIIIITPTNGRNWKLVLSLAPGVSVFLSKKIFANCFHLFFFCHNLCVRVHMCISIVHSVLVCVCDCVCVCACAHVHLHLHCETQGKAVFCHLLYFVGVCVCEYNMHLHLHSRQGGPLSPIIFISCTPGSSYVSHCWCWGSLLWRRIHREGGGCSGDKSEAYESWFILQGDSTFNIFN